MVTKNSSHAKLNYLKKYGVSVGVCVCCDSQSVPVFFCLRRVICLFATLALIRFILFFLIPFFFYAKVHCFAISVCVCVSV